MKHTTLYALLLLLLALPLRAQVTDEFDEDQLRSEWTWLREDVTRWKLQPDVLVIYTQPGALNGVLFNNVRNMLLQPVTTTSDVSFETELTFDPMYEYRNAGIVYYIDDDNYIRVSRGIYEGHDDIWMEWEVAGITQFVYAAATAPLSCRLQLSILKDGSFRASWSEVGMGWKPFAHQAIAFPTGAATVGLQAANGDGMAAARSPVAAIFQYFHVNKPVSVAAMATAQRLFIGAPYPSPARLGESTTVQITTDRPTSLRYTVTDLLGREVLHVQNLGIVAAGSHNLILRIVPPVPGVYLLHFENGGQRTTRRLVLTR